VLVVDDFGIKYLKKEDLDHLVNLLKRYYDVSVDLDGKEFVKIELDWDYNKGEVHLSMEPYLRKALRHSTILFRRSVEILLTLILNRNTVQKNNSPSTILHLQLERKDKSIFRR